MAKKERREARDPVQPVGHGHFDLSAYEAFLNGKLEDANIRLRRLSRNGRSAESQHACITRLLDGNPSSQFFFSRISLKTNYISMLKEN